MTLFIKRTGLLVSIFASLTLLSFTNTSTNFSQGQTSEKKDPVVIIFSIVRTIQWQGCLVTATISVSVVVDKAKGEVLSASAQLVSGTIDCGTPTMTDAKVNVENIDSGLTLINISESDNSDWEEGMDTQENSMLIEANERILSEF